MAPKNFRPSKHAPPALNIMIGVAGHIDHGKTELVKMMTGCNTDRLKEEQERGMSIELGFAPCYLQDACVGIVDVPGHERFVRKMVAGATGIDIALLVIAADDGVMPQTREHLDVIELLGVKHLLVALSKIDLAAEERVQQVKNEIRQFLQTTDYPQAPIYPVSALTGEGIDPIKNALIHTVDSVQRKKTTGVFRLPIERIFSLQGHGTIVTGIASAGTVKVNDAVEILPLGKTTRVRGLQVYLHDSNEGMAGQCVALNLAGIGHDELQRGHVVACPGRFSTTEWVTVRLQASRFIENPIKNSCRVYFHTGTAEILGKIRFLDRDELEAGQHCFAQVFLDRAAPIFLKDRFIVRLPSPAMTIGGGVIIESPSQRYKRFDTSQMQWLANRWNAIDSDKDFLSVVLDESRDTPLSLQDAARKAGIKDSDAQHILGELVQKNDVFKITDTDYFATKNFHALKQSVLNTINQMHDACPECFAFALDDIKKQSSADAVLLKRALGDLVNENQLHLTSGLYRSANAVSIDPKLLALAGRIEKILLEERFKTSAPDQLAEQVRQPLPAVEKALKFLCDSEKVLRLAEKIYIHHTHVEWAKNELVAILRKEGSFETHKFKTVIDSSRKYAIPLLDHFDSIGLTRRTGGERYLCE